jgi:hypothetical protein
MKEAQAQQADLSEAMGADYKSRFGEQTNLIDALTRAMSPALSTGASSHGYSASELSAKNTEALDAAGASYKNAAQAAGNAMAGRGGDSGLVSGVDQQIRASIASKAASDLARRQNEIVDEDFSVGRDEYHRAEAGLDFLAEKVLDPTALGADAIGANKESFLEANANNNANNQKWADIGGLLGGATKLIPGISTGIKSLAGMFHSGDLSDNEGS